MGECRVEEWTVDEVCEWAKKEKLSERVVTQIQNEEIDGRCLLCLTEKDLRTIRTKHSRCELTIGDMKKLSLAVRSIQKDNHASLVYLGLCDNHPVTGALPAFGGSTADVLHLNDIERISPPMSVDGRATSIQPEFFKTMISLGEFYYSRDIPHYFPQGSDNKKSLFPADCPQESKQSVR